ncbi:MAG: hypothetical protein J4G05_10860 [Chlorobi bacterium]|nr:hypothetical protein [Chlorobiota bacterium]
MGLILFPVLPHVAIYGASLRDYPMLRLSMERRYATRKHWNDRHTTPACRASLGAGRPLASTA